MADRLAEPDDLAAMPGMPSEIDQAWAYVLLEAATAAVQDAAGQRLVQDTSTATLLGDVGSWLQLPQQPVTAVTSVELDGQPVTDWRRFGSRLWRADGWQIRLHEPSAVAVVYSHGHSPVAQQLQLARSTVLMLAKQAYLNPRGVKSETYPEYAYVLAGANAQLEASPNLKASLRRAYGIRAGLARIGGS